MSKHLISLVLVLAIAGLASAADFYWNSDVASGNWSVASNWRMGGTAGSPLATALPANGDQAWVRPSLNGSISTGPVTINLTMGATVSRINMNSGTMTLNIQSGATLTNNGTLAPTGLQFYNTSGTCAINVYGNFYNERSDGTSFGWRIGGGPGAPTNQLNIYAGGLMTVKSTGANAVFGVGTTGTGGGSATVNIWGILDVDSYLFGALASKSINIHGNGEMWVKGNVVSTAQADINAGLITGVAASSVYYDAAVGKTIIPEPATIALLGLGGLLLRRKR